MCCSDVSPTSTFLIGLMCLTAFSNFAKTSADFSGRGEALILSYTDGCLWMRALITAFRSSSEEVNASRSGVVKWGVILVF